MKQQVLFIDRDGTLAIEPPIDFQLDSFEKLEFFPGVFQFLGKIAKELNFKIVMVTNQDGLGTDSFPEDTFWPVHNFLIQSFKNEGVEFDEEMALAISSGKRTIANNVREGIVIKQIIEKTNPGIGRVILKIINDDYLLRTKGTEFH